MKSGTGNSGIAADTANNSADRYYASDITNPKFFISAIIDGHSNTLRFTIVTKIRSSGERSSIPPEDFFDEMMSHFLSRGGYPDAIRGIWNDSDAEKTTNINIFNSLVAAGRTEEEAARGTFTGRMAAKYGFLKVSFGPFDPPNGPAPYESVSAYFKT